MPRKLYVPVFDSFFESSIMHEEVTTRFVFLALLRLAYRSGAHGEVDVDPGIFAQGINIPLPDVERSIARLMEPDPRSASPDEDGRRLVPLDPSRPFRGWKLVNWDRYRQMLHRANDAARKREDYHERKSTLGISESLHRPPAPPRPPKVSDLRVFSRHETKRNETKRINPPSPPSGGGGPGDLLRIWNENRGKLPEATRLSKDRERHARARLAEEPNLELWAQVVRRLAASSFCLGSGEKGWRATFDFLLRPGTLAKALEGAYDDRLPIQGGPNLVNGRYRLPSGWSASQDGSIIEKDFKTFERRRGSAGARYVHEDQDGVAVYVTGAAIQTSSYTPEIREREKTILQGHPRFVELFPEESVKPS
jgi:hypothetical protein